MTLFTLAMAISCGNLDAASGWYSVLITLPAFQRRSCSAQRFLGRGLLRGALWFAALAVVVTTLVGRQIAWRARTRRSGTVDDGLRDALVTSEAPTVPPTATATAGCRICLGRSGHGIRRRQVDAYRRWR